jgi:hypothetical protein
VGFGECLEGRAGEIIRLKSHSHSLAFLLYLLLLFEKKKKKKKESAPDLNKRNDHFKILPSK